MNEILIVFIIFPRTSIFFNLSSRNNWVLYKIWKISVNMRSHCFLYIIHIFSILWIFPSLNCDPGNGPPGRDCAEFHRCGGNVTFLDVPFYSASMEYVESNPQTTYSSRFLGSDGSVALQHMFPVYFLKYNFSEYCWVSYGNVYTSKSSSVFDSKPW